jgi:hypothetical protein
MDAMQCCIVVVVTNRRAIDTNTNQHTTTCNTACMCARVKPKALTEVTRAIITYEILPRLLLLHTAKYSNSNCGAAIPLSSVEELLSR